MQDPVPGNVVQDERLAKPLGEPLSNQARLDVRRAARCIVDDDGHRPHRIGLRPRNTRQPGARQRPQPTEIVGGEISCSRIPSGHF